MPFSGPASAYATIGKAQAAYMKMINEQGGVNGRKINLIQYDDSYSPPKTVEQVRKLVEGDEVLLTFQLLGTPPNAAVQKYLNQKKIPQLLAGTGADRFSDPRTIPGPWASTLPTRAKAGSTPSTSSPTIRMPRSRSCTRTTISAATTSPGLKAGLGDKAKTMIVAEASYELTDPTIDSQS